MERGRVVYYAKTKTSKVLTPSSTKRQQTSSSSSSSSTVDSEPQAPLAAGESDILAPARPAPHMPDQHGSTTRKAWRPVRGERGPDLPSSTFENGADPTARSKVEQGSTTLPNGNGASKTKCGDLSPSSPTTERRIVQGPVLTAPPATKERNPNKMIQKPGPGKITKDDRAATKNVNVTQAGRKNSSKDFTHDFQAVTTVTRSPGGYTKQTVITNMPPSLMFQNDNVFPTMYIGNGPTLNSSLSIKDLPSEDPAMPLRNVRDKKQQGVKSRVGSDKGVSGLHSDPRVTSVIEDTIGGEVSCNNLTESVVTLDQNSTVLEWTIDENNAIICRKVSIKSNTRPEIEYLDKSNSSCDSKYESISSGSLPSLVSDNKFDPRFSSHEHKYFDPESSIGRNDRLHQQSASSEQVSHAPSDECASWIHNSQSASDLEPADPTSPRMRLKRNSLRLATQGFVSMSDLTDSLECVQLVSRERDEAQSAVSKFSDDVDHDSSSSSEEFLDAVLEHDTGTHNGIVLSGDVLYSSNGQIFTFFEQLDALRPKPVNKSCDDDGDNTRQQEGHEVSVETSTQASVLSNLEANALSCPDISTPVPNGNSFRNNVKRASFKLATASASDLSSANEVSRDDIDGPIAMPSTNVKHRNSSEKLKYLHATSNRTDGEENEVSGTLKRRSYILATTESLTDLPCEVEKPDVVDSSPLSKRSVRTGSVRAESFDSGKCRTTPLFARRGSVSSSQLNSSFGSFYSCQSLDFAKPKPSPKGGRLGESRIKDGSPASRVRLREGSHDMSSSDGSESVNTSLYYSASDTSFRTPDIGGSQRPRVDSTSSRRSPLFWRKPAASLSDDLLKGSNKRSAKIHSHSHIPLFAGKGQRSLKRLNTVFQCYGCGFDYGHPSVTQRKNTRERRTESAKNTFVPTPNMPVTKPSGRLSDNRTRCNTVPSLSERSRQLDLQFLDRGDPLTYGTGLDISPVSPCSIDSDSDEWESTPRSPPALGRPKRKVYAGFDSQPLPMDSFMSDSSSVYTDCGGSWSSRATSRSAEMEKSYHERGSAENLSANMRSVSAMAPGTATPTRQMSQETLLEFLRYGDKQHAVGENNHNVYVSRGNSHANDKVKDTFEGKTFSNESLNSNLSTVTTTSSHHHGNTGNSHDDVTKVPAECTRQNNHKKQNVEKRTNELPQDCGAQDRKSWAFDFRFRDSHEFLSNAWSDDDSKLHRPLKGSSSATIPKSKFQPKRRYFSTKDILDLIMTSERKGNGRSISTTSLEKHAQKVCRVILCCNDMEGPIPVRQFHY
ncbi:unnamed protein product [Lymnaea stagnalis]|uniref:Uncharacterized protein n=1 Tax=Lymnaea stagnalis TaxID=6523 RepID=A0AAV2HZD6_LYMST